MSILRHSGCREKALVPHKRLEEHYHDYEANHEN
jgi:hypothetical protein